MRDAGELRVKESDRLSAVTQNLRAMGAQVEQTADGWRIPGGQKLHGAEIESFGDHRIAMAFAIAALRAEGETAHPRFGVRCDFLSRFLRGFGTAGGAIRNVGGQSYAEATRGSGSEAGLSRTTVSTMG